MLTNAQIMPGQEPQRGEVTRELEVMSKNLAQLESLCGEVESKLAAVLAVRLVDAETSAQSEPEAVRVPLAQDLYRFNVRLVERENHLRSILSRIEL